MNIDAFCRWLSRHYFVVGMDADDIYQEARLAAWLAPAGLEHIAARRQVYDLMRIGQRRRFDTLGHDMESVSRSSSDVVDIVDARDRLRAIMAAPRTENERTALRHRVSGTPIPNSAKSVWGAWLRMRDRVAA